MSLEAVLDPEFTTRLKDGTSVLIRTGDPCDQACIAAGFERLSARSRNLRFFSPINKLTQAQLDYLTHIDNVNHVVITASDNAGDEPVGMGLARYIRLQDDPHVAEFAITVIDDYQGRGLGPVLLDILAKRARANGIHILRAFVLKSNAAMIKMLQRKGGNGTQEKDGTLRFDLPLEHI